jgi:hypothetical protein
MTAAPGIVVDGGGIRDYGGAGSMFPSTTSRVDDGLMAAARRFRVGNSDGPRCTPKLDARDSEKNRRWGEATHVWGMGSRGGGGRGADARKRGQIHAGGRK